MVLGNKKSAIYARRHNMTLISKLKQHVHDLDEWSRLPFGKAQKLKYNIILTQYVVLVKCKTLYI